MATEAETELRPCVLYETPPSVSTLRPRQGSGGSAGNQLREERRIWVILDKLRLDPSAVTRQRGLDSRLLLREHPTLKPSYAAFLAVWLMGMVAACSGPPPSASPEAATAPSPPAVKVGHGVGDRAPEFSLTLADGGTVASASLTDKGKPVFLFFLATW